MATQTQPADQAAAKKKRGKGILITALLLVLIGGGAGAWYYLRVYTHDAPKPPKPAAFLALESFTVNLIGDDTQPQPQYLQASLTLKLFDSGHTNLIKHRMPEIRNRILFVLSSKKVKELLSVDGKRKLAIELADAVKEVIAPSSVQAAAAAVTAAPAAGVANAAVSAAPVPSVLGEAQAAPVAENTPSEPAQAEQSTAAGPAVESGPRAPPAPAVEVLFTSFIVQ